MTIDYYCGIYKNRRISMKELMIETTRRLGALFKEKSNIIILLLLLNLFTNLYTYVELSDENYHYYKNLSRSLEVVTGEKFDDYDGSIQRELLADEKVQRKRNRTFHLKYKLKALFNW